MLTYKNTHKKPVNASAVDKKAMILPLGLGRKPGSSCGQHSACCKRDQFGLQNEVSWNAGSEGLLVLSKVAIVLQVFKCL